MCLQDKAPSSCFNKTIVRQGRRQDGQAQIKFPSSADTEEETKEEYPWAKHKALSCLVGSGVLTPEAHRLDSGTG